MSDMKEDVKKYFGQKDTSGAVFINIINIVLLVGVILATVLFFVFIPETDRKAPVILDFIVIIWVLLLNMGFLQWIALEMKNKPADNAGFPSFIVQGGIIWGYDLLAVITVVASIAMKLLFPLVIAIHSALFFLLVISLVLSVILMRFAGSVGASEAGKMEDIKWIRSEFESLVYKMNNLPPELDGVKKAFSGLKDEVRYISPGNSPAAKSLEAEIRKALETVKGAVEGFLTQEKGSPQQDLQALLNAQLRVLTENIDRRKKVYDE